MKKSIYIQFRENKWQAISEGKVLFEGDSSDMVLELVLQSKALKNAWVKVENKNGALIAAIPV